MLLSKQANHIIKKRCVGLYIKFRRLNEKQMRIIVDPHELKALAVCRKILRYKDSKLRIDPITNDRICENEMLGISFILQSGEHGYSLDLFDTHLHTVVISEHGYMMIVQVFNYHCHKNRDILKEMIYASVEDDFENMCKKCLPNESSNI